MDSFIIYRSATRNPLNLDYLILKEMVDVRNHKNQALPFGALFTKIFEQFRVRFSNQHKTVRFASSYCIELSSQMSSARFIL